MQTKLKPFLIGFVVLIVMLNLALAGVLSYMLSTVNRSLNHEHSVTNPLVEHLQEAKFQIVQIQQFLTDAAVTGEQDGIADGESAYRAAIEAANNIARIDPSLLSSIQPMLEQINKLHSTGLEMVKAYKKSQQEGNRLMKSPDGFDHQSELLQTSIARLSSEINQKQTSTAAEVEQNIHFSQSISLLLSALMIAVILTAGRILYVRVFTQLGGEPASGVKMAQAIAMGDLTQKICVEGNNRDSLLGHLDAMRARWTDVVSSLNGQVWLMLKEFGDLKQQSEAMAEHCGKQNEATMSISANVEELSVTAEQIADRSCAAAKQALRSGKSSEQAMKIIADMVSEIENAFGHVKHSVQLSSTLDQCTNEIESVTTTIRAIAEQTNLLALNAAIEAARAGESGRGFAVVADEVRQLATRAAEATSFIEKLISEVRKNTGEIVQVIGHGTDKVRSSLQCSEKAIHAINEVLSDSALTRSEVDFINNALTEQKAAMQDIVEKIVHIATMSDKNAHAADAISHTAQNLDAVAQAVQKEISYFKFADEETGKPRGDVLF